MYYENQDIMDAFRTIQAIRAGRHSPHLAKVVREYLDAGFAPSDTPWSEADSKRAKDIQYLY